MKKFLTALGIFTSAILLAEEAAAAPANTSVITLGKIFSNGGWVMYFIAALSFWGVALIILNYVISQEKVLCPGNFLNNVLEAAEVNEIKDVQELCQQENAPAARIIEAMLPEIRPNRPVDPQKLRSAMEDEGARQGAILWQKLQLLMDVAVISPMVGLLGTVWGLMVSFGGIENGADFAKKAETMANGISQAIYTTFGGLIVGIFAMLFYNFLRGRLTKKLAYLEKECAEVLHAVIDANEASQEARK